MEGVDLVTEAVSEYFVGVLIGVCFLVVVILKALVTVFTTATRERTRREIAAYIAEGSMTPDQGERLMRAETVKKA